MKTEKMRKSKNVEDKRAESMSKKDYNQQFANKVAKTAKDSEHLMKTESLYKTSPSEYDNMMNAYIHGGDGVETKTRNILGLKETRPPQKIKEIKDDIYPRQYFRAKGL